MCDNMSIMKTDEKKSMEKSKIGQVNENQSRSVNYGIEPGFSQEERENINSAQKVAVEKLTEKLRLQQEFGIRYKGMDFDSSRTEMEEQDQKMKEIEDIEAEEKNLAKIKDTYGVKKDSAQLDEVDTIYQQYFQNQYGGDIEQQIRILGEKKKYKKDKLVEKSKNITEQIAKYEENAKKEKENRRIAVNDAFEKDKTISFKGKKRDKRKEGLQKLEKTIIGATEETAAMVADMQHRQERLDKWKKQGEKLKIKDEDIALTGDEFKLVFKNGSGSAMNIKGVMEKLTKMQMKLNRMSDEDPKKAQLKENRELLLHTFQVVCAANGIDYENNDFFKQDTEASREETRKKVEYANAVYQSALQEYKDKVKGINRPDQSAPKNETLESRYELNERTKEEILEEDKLAFFSTFQAMRMKEGTAEIPEDVWNATMSLCTSYDASLFKEKDNGLEERRQRLKEENSMISELLKGNVEKTFRVAIQKMEQLASLNVSIDTYLKKEIPETQKAEYEALASAVSIIKHGFANGEWQNGMDLLKESKLLGESEEQIYENLAKLFEMQNVSINQLLYQAQLERKRKEAGLPEYDPTWKAAKILCSQGHKSFQKETSMQSKFYQESYQQEQTFIQAVFAKNKEGMAEFVAKKILELKKAGITVETAYDVEKVRQNPKAYQELAAVREMMNLILAGEQTEDEQTETKETESVSNQVESDLQAVVQEKIAKQQKKDLLNILMKGNSPKEFAKLYAGFAYMTNYSYFTGKMVENQAQTQNSGEMKTSKERLAAFQNEIPVRIGAVMKERMAAFYRDFDKEWNEKTEIDDVLEKYQNLNMKLMQEEPGSFYDEDISLLEEYQDKMVREKTKLTEKVVIAEKMGNITKNMRMYLINQIMLKKQAEKMEDVNRNREKYQKKYRLVDKDYEDDKDVRAVLEKVSPILESHFKEAFETSNLKRMLVETEKLQSDFEKQSNMTGLSETYEIARVRSEMLEEEFNERINSHEKNQMTVEESEYRKTTLENEREETLKQVDRKEKEISLLKNRILLLRYPSNMNELTKSQVKENKKEAEKLQKEVNNLNKEKQELDARYLKIADEIENAKKDIEDCKKFEQDTNELKDKLNQANKLMRNLKERQIQKKDWKQTFKEYDDSMELPVNNIMCYANKKSNIEKEYKDYFAKIEHCNDELLKLKEERILREKEWRYYRTRSQFLKDSKAVDLEQYREICKAYFQQEATCEKKTLSEKELDEKIGNALKPVKTKNLEKEKTECITKMQELKAYFMDESIEKGYQGKASAVNAESIQATKDFAALLRKKFDSHRNKSTYYHETMSKYLEKLKESPEKQDYVLSKLDRRLLYEYINYGQEVNDQTNQTLQDMAKNKKEAILNEIEQLKKMGQVEQVEQLRAIINYLDKEEKGEDISDEERTECFSKIEVTDAEIEKMKERIGILHEKIQLVEKDVSEAKEEIDKKLEDEEALNKAYRDRMTFTKRCFTGMRGMVGKIKETVIDALNDRENVFEKSQLNELEVITTEYSNYMEDSKTLMENKQKEFGSQDTPVGLTMNTLGIQRYLLGPDHYGSTPSENHIKEKSYGLKKSYFKTARNGESSYTTVDLNRLMQVRSKLINWLSQNQDLALKDHTNMGFWERLWDNLRSRKQQKYDRRAERLEKLNQFLKLYCEANGVDFESGLLLYDLGLTQEEVEKKVKVACLLMEDSMIDIQENIIANGEDDEDDEDDEDEEEEKEEKKEEKDEEKKEEKEEEKEEKGNFFRQCMDIMTGIKEQWDALQKNIKNFNDKNKLFEEVEAEGLKMDLSELYTFFEKDSDVNLAQYEKKVRTRHSELGVSAKLLEAQAACKAAFVSGKVKDKKTGKENFAFGACVEASAAFSAFSAEFTAKFGVEKWGLTTGVETTGQVAIGEASANAKLQIAFTDDFGHLDPKVALNLGAEAALLKLSGSITGKLLGLGLTAEASFILGAAANLNVKFENWKLTVNCAAALGIGVSVKLEIDVGEIKDKILEFVKDKGIALKNDLFEYLIIKGYNGDSEKFYSYMQDKINNTFKENEGLYYAKDSTPQVNT